MEVKFELYIWMEAETVKEAEANLKEILNKKEIHDYDIFSHKIESGSPTPISDEE